MILVRSLLVLAMALVLEACPGCDQAGCYQGLIVEVNGPPAAYRIEARVAGAQAVFGANCVGGRCNAHFIDFMPREVTVAIVTESDTIYHDVRPRYEQFYPNGPDCEPMCRIATVTLTP
jgi:hypothetical protein